MSAQIHQIATIDPTNETEAIIDLAEAGRLEEMCIVISALANSVVTAMLNDDTRRQLLTAYRDGDLDDLEARLRAEIAELSNRQIAIKLGISYASMRAIERDVELGGLHEHQLSCAGGAA